MLLIELFLFKIESFALRDKLSILPSEFICLIITSKIIKNILLSET